MRRAAIIAAIVLTVVAGLFVFANQGQRGDDASSESASQTDGPGTNGSSTSNAESANAEEGGSSSGAEPKSAEGTASASDDTANRNMPAKEGEPLSKVTEPPSSTIAFIGDDNERDKATYTLRFQPFGEGPRITGERTLVVVVIRSTPSGASPGTRDYALKHLLLRPKPQMWETIKRGGTYEGTVVFKEQERGLAPNLETVTMPKAP